MYAVIYFLHFLPMSELFLLDEQSWQVFNNTKLNLSILTQPIIATY